MLLAFLVGALVLPGAGCPRMMHHYAASPVVRTLPEEPTLDQLIEQVNANTARVESLVCQQTTISGQGLARLSAMLAYERPRHLRLLAKTAFSGPEVDLGSNDDLFWFWVRRNTPPAVYFCRHEDFASSRVQTMLPIDPEWLIGALGLVTLTAEDRHEGPYPLPKDRWEIRTFHSTPRGVTTQITVVDAARGWVLEQHVYDAQGQRVASAIASGHRLDPASQATLPAEVRIEWPLAQFAITLTLGETQINTGLPPGDALWAKPHLAEAPDIDLAQGLGAPGTPAATAGFSNP